MYSVSILELSEMKDFKKLVPVEIDLFERQTLTVYVVIALSLNDTVECWYSRQHFEEIFGRKQNELLEVLYSAYSVYALCLCGKSSELLGTQNSFIGVSILGSIMAFHYYSIKTLKLCLLKCVPRIYLRL